MKADNRVEFKVDGNKISATLKWSTKEDIGTYKIVLTNSHGPAESSANLNVRAAKKEPPKILKGLENQIVAKGDELVFIVQIEGEVTDLVWKKDGQRIEKTTSAVLDKIDDQTYRLRIPAAELTDQGEYEVSLNFQKQTNIFILNIFIEYSFR